MAQCNQIAFHLAFDDLNSVIWQMCKFPIFAIEIQNVLKVEGFQSNDIHIVEGGGGGGRKYSSFAIKSFFPVRRISHLTNGSLIFSGRIFEHDSECSFAIFQRQHIDDLILF